MATVVQVASRKYKRGGVIYEIPYFAEDSTGYPNCASLVSLDVPHKVCRAKVAGGTLTRMYAGLVPVSDPRASARRRYVAGIGELAYMKGTYGVYTVQALALTDSHALHLFPTVLFSKRLSGYEAYNMRISIRGTGGRGAVRKYTKAGNKTVITTVQDLSFDENIGVHATHEWSLLLDSGSYDVYWYTEFLGATDWASIYYPSDTPA